MRMGLILMNITPMKALMKRKQLTKNCQASSLGEEKLSAVHNNKVAAANNPTTAGRNPLKMLSTEWVCMYFINILLISIIKISEGSTSAKVATADPRIATEVEYPALMTAV